MFIAMTAPAWSGIYNWFDRANPSPAPLWGIAYGNGLYVAVGLWGTVLTSTDGEDWSLVNSNVMEGLYSIIYADNKFVAVGGWSSNSGVILTSEDGVNWNAQHISAYLNAIAYGNGTFVAVGQHGAIATSPDGIAWDFQTSGTSFRGIAFGNGKFVAVGDNIYTSPDGLDWSPGYLPSWSDVLLDVTFGNGTFVAVGFFSDNIYTSYTSPDGEDWAYQDMALPNNYLTGVGYGNGEYVIVSCDIYDPGTPRTFCTSQDALQWYAYLPGHSGNLYHVKFVNDTFIAVGQHGNTGTDGMILQSDSCNAELDSLALSSGALDPAFTPSITTYSAQVGNSVSSITATPVVHESHASVTVNGVAVPSGTASGQMDLSVGPNLIAVAVTAQDGTIRTYSVTVTREEAGYATIPGIIQAEDFETMSGVIIENTSDAGGGQDVGDIQTGDWMDYLVNVTQSGLYKIEYRAWNDTTPAGIMNLQRGSETLAYTTLNNTAFPANKTWISILDEDTVHLDAGVQTLRIYAKKGTGCKLNWITFTLQ